MSQLQRLRPIDLRGDVELRGSAGRLGLTANGATLTFDFDTWYLLGRVTRPLLAGGAAQRARVLDRTLATLRALDLQLAVRVGAREIARLPTTGGSSLLARLLGIRGVRIGPLDLARTTYAAFRRDRPTA